MKTTDVLIKETDKSQVVETLLLEDSNSGLIKIVKSNMTSHSDLLPENKSLYVVMVIHGDVEAKLHDKYAKRRLKEKWFNLSDYDLIDIYKTYKIN